MLRAGYLGATLPASPLARRHWARAPAAADLKLRAADHAAPVAHTRGGKRALPAPAHGRRPSQPAPVAKRPPLLPLPLLVVIKSGIVDCSHTSR